MVDLLVLLVQIGVVLVAARVVGAAFRRIGQPQVVWPSDGSASRRSSAR